MTAQMKGLPEEDIRRVRRGEAREPNHAALVRFTGRVLETKGFVDDADLEAFRHAGYTDEHIAEVVTVLAQKTLSNYFNHIHETPLDFPAAAES